MDILVAMLLLFAPVIVMLIAIGICDAMAERRERDPAEHWDHWGA